jgi:hypothetical protein
MVDLLTIVPDLRLKLEEHATSDEFTFVRWTGRGTGPGGPFEANGIDRIRMCNSKVVENRIVSDAAIFEDLACFVGERRRLFQKGARQPLCAA